MPYPTVAVITHLSYINSAFFRAIQRMPEFQMNILPIPYCSLIIDVKKAAEEYLNPEHVHGLILAGSLIIFPNEHFVPTETYSNNLFEGNNKDKEFFMWQTAFLNRALTIGMPILGICAGSTLIFVHQDGKLEKISEENSIKHDIYPIEGALAHEVTVINKTHLHDILADINERKGGDLLIQVNSWHSTRNKKLPDSLIASAIASDGGIEAFEMKDPGNPNCWGIQFHPEYLKENTKEYSQQTRIFEAFRIVCLQFKEKNQLNIAIKKLYSNSENERILPKRARESQPHLFFNPKKLLKKDIQDLQQQREKNYFCTLL